MVQASVGAIRPSERSDQQALSREKLAADLAGLAEQQQLGRGRPLGDLRCRGHARGRHHLALRQRRRRRPAWAPCSDCMCPCGTSTHVRCACCTQGRSCMIQGCRPDRFSHQPRSASRASLTAERVLSQAAQHATARTSKRSWCCRKCRSNRPPSAPWGPEVRPSRQTEAGPARHKQQQEQGQERGWGRKRHILLPHTAGGRHRRPAAAPLRRTGHIRLRQMHRDPASHVMLLHRHTPF